MNKLQQQQENKWRQMRQVRQLSTTKTNAPNDTISPTHMLLSLFISLVHNLPLVFDNSQTRKNTPQELCSRVNCYTTPKRAVLFSIPPYNISESSRLRDSKESVVRKWQFCRHIRLRFDIFGFRLRAESLLPVVSRQLPAVNKVKQFELVSGVQLAKARNR